MWHSLGPTPDPCQHGPSLIKKMPPTHSSSRATNHGRSGSSQRAEGRGPLPWWAVFGRGSGEQAKFLKLSLQLQVRCGPRATVGSSAPPAPTHHSISTSHFPPTLAKRVFTKSPNALTRSHLVRNVLHMAYDGTTAEYPLRAATRQTASRPGGQVCIPNF